MIDFRYHLVSIVSIFLALAVGIVLGAGPLQGQIGNTLTSEITQLRQDKSSLRSEVTSLNKVITDQDQYAQASLGRVISGVTSGRGIAVVALPGIDNDSVNVVTSAVGLAGGTVASVTKIQASWLAADSQNARDDLAAHLAPSLRVTSGSSSAQPPSLADRVLAAALTSRSGTGTGVGQEAARAALASLVSGKFVDVDTKNAVTAQLVIVLGVPLTGSTPAAQQAAATAWTRLAQAFDAASAGSVVATINPSGGAPTGSTSVVASVRKDAAAAQAVSTVDDAERPMGVASIFLALAQQESGVTGHYGEADGASAPYAPMPKS